MGLRGARAGDRARRLAALISHRAARRYSSPAFAANALHFGSDLAGSLAVLVGLIFVAARLAQRGRDRGAVRGGAGRDRGAAAGAPVRRRADGPRLARRRGADPRRAGRRSPTRSSCAACACATRPGAYFVDLVIARRARRRRHAGPRDRRRRRGARAGGARRADVVVHVEPADAAPATCASAPPPRRRRAGGARGPQRARDGRGRPSRAVAAREAAARALADRGPRRGRAPRGGDPRGAPGPAQRAHPHRAAGRHRLRQPARVRRDRDRARGDRGGGAPPPRRAAPVSVRFRDGEGGRIALVTVALPGEQPLPSAHRHAGAIEEAVRERARAWRT